MPSRDLNDLLPGTRAKVEAWLDACCHPDVLPQVFITCTYRSQEEQDTLYAKGRTEPGRKVTWTKHSYHTQRRAVDFALKIPDPWDMKVDIDHDKIPDFLEVGALAETFGLTWGGRWDTPDYPHVQDDEIYMEGKV
jgi:peptidoglycan L-alanyl-D-glutamate endopeptidase CwlK